MFFRPRLDCSTSEFTVEVVTSTRLKQGSSQSAFQHGCRRNLWGSAPAEDLLAVGEGWGGRSHFSFRMWPVVSCPESCGWPQTHVYIWAALTGLWAYRRRKERRQRWEGLENIVEINVKMCVRMKISKNKKIVVKKKETNNYNGTHL